MIKKALYLLVVTTLLIGCSGGENLSDETSISINDTLDAWMKRNRPDIEKNEDGFYLKITRNSSVFAKEPTDSSAVGINYNVQTIDGNYAANTNKLKALELGTFSTKTNYAPFMFILNNYFSYNGLSYGMYEAIKDMKVGDTAELYMTPGYGSNGIDSVYLGFRGNKALAVGKISHVKLSLDSVNFDPKDNEKALITDYSDTNFSNKRIKIREGIYLDKTHVVENIADTIPSDTTLRVDYIGYLPNGFVFDTSLEEVAKENHFYNETLDYEPLEVEFNRKDTTDFGSTVRAWKYAIENMKIGEKATFISNSEYCYGNSGQYGKSTILPIFTPLIFEIHILTPEESEARLEEED